MKKKSKRILNILASAMAVTALSTGVIPDIAGMDMSPFVVKADAASYVNYVNSSGSSVRINSYRKMKSTTTSLNGGYYYVSGTVTINDRVYVTSDTGIILGSGCKLICRKGIEVANGVRFNIYTQSGSTGSLYAGTSDGKNTTADAGDSGIGGEGASVNIVGGKVYARGGRGAYGIEGRSIKLQHTNKRDIVHASSYSTSVDFCKGFVNMSTGKIYYGKGINSRSIGDVKLDSAVFVTSATNSMRNDEYIAMGSVAVSDRLEIIGDVDLYLADNANMSVVRGINVEQDDKFKIYGNTGTLSVGTRDGYNALTDSYTPGIGADSKKSTGEIVINGGIIFAAGGRYAAGIGGSNALVEINGGIVRATGGEYAAAIGSNYNDKGAEIKITGGQVSATANATGGYGIGSGNNSSKSRISLGLKSADDYITSTTYNGSVSFSKTLYTSDYKIANQGNIAGKVLKAQSTRTNATITYETNGAGRVSSRTMYTGNTINYFPSVYKYGYVLEGWYTDPSFMTRVTADTVVMGDMVLYAKWMPAYNYGYWNYYYGYDWDYYNNYDYWNQYNNYWDYYDYQSWLPYYYGPDYWNYYNDYYNYNYYDRSYYNTRTISFDTNGSESINSISVPYGMTIRKLPYVTRNGYVFDGWYTDKNCYYEFDMNEPIYSNMTLYAKWIPNSYYNQTCYVNFVTNNGSYVSRRSVKYGDTLGYMPYVERSGYIFDGWYMDENFSYRVNENTPIYSDMTFYAKWIRSSDISSVQVYFDAGYGWFPNGDVMITKSLRAGGRASDVYPMNPSYRTGYVFVGWYYDREFTRPYNNEPLYSNTMLYAKYEIVYR